MARARVDSMIGHMALLTERSQIIWIAILLISINMMGIKSLVGFTTILALVACALSYLFLEIRTERSRIRPSSIFPVVMILSRSSISIFGSLPNFPHGLLPLRARLKSFFRDVEMTSPSKILASLSVSVEKHKSSCTTTNTSPSGSEAVITERIASAPISFPTHALSRSTTRGAFQLSMHGRSIHG